MKAERAFLETKETLLKLIEANTFGALGTSRDTVAEAKAEQIISVHKKLMEYYLSID